MKCLFMFCILILPWGFHSITNAQQSVPVAGDSVAIEKLLEIIEANSSFRIYTDIDRSFNVLIKTNNASPIQLLENALAETPYKVSVFGDHVFVLKTVELDVRCAILPGKTKIPENPDKYFTQTEGTEKATSENVVYVIGNPYVKEVPAKILLKGKVTDFKTGDPFIGVHLILKEPYVVATTDRDGNYSIQLPSGRIQLDISGLNLQDSRRQLMLYGGGTLDIELTEKIYQLDEITITAEKIDNVKGLQLGVEQIQVAKIKNIPMALGEVDLLRVIQTLPGIKTVGEASSGFNVRGGATDQNLILLNNGTIYNPNHLFGLFTAFSSDMIKTADIYKSSIPAQYGGRISSVLDITGKEASKEKFNGSAGIGLVTSRLNLEIPLVKERTSLLLSGRTTYSDWILRRLPSKSGYNNGTAGFYDLGMVFSHQIDKKNALNIYGYFSSDRFAFDANKKYTYNTLNVSAKWKRQFSEKFVGTLAAGSDHYNYKNTETTIEAEAHNLSFDINEIFVKADLTYYMDKHKIDFGFKSMFYNIGSGTYEPLGEASLVQHDALQNDKALESALHIGDQWDITPEFSVNAGIRYSIFNAMGPRTYYQYDPSMIPYESTIIDSLSVGSGKIFKTYHGPELRLSARYIINGNLSVKAGFNSMRQYIHKLSNTVIMSPTDIWKLSDANIRPQKGWQVATGLYWNSSRNNWESSIEVYYKRMNDYLDYRSGARLLMNHHIETDVINTEGYAYGAELSIRKSVGKLNGWANYTYSRTFLRQSDDLISNPVNNGDWYPTNYDKPHDFKLTGNYKFTQRYSFSINVDYSTGRPTTIPAGKYYNQELKSIQIYYTDRNSYRIPDYFRTDLSFNIEPSHRLRKLSYSSISFGVYNVTGRKNVYSIYFVSEEGIMKGYQMSVIGMPIPFISYNVRF